MEASMQMVSNNKWVLGLLWKPMKNPIIRMNHQPEEEKLDSLLMRLEFREMELGFHIRHLKIRKMQ